MRKRQSVSLEKGPFNRYCTCHWPTDYVEAGHDTRGIVPSESFLFFRNGLVRRGLL